MKVLRGDFLPHRNTYLFEGEPSIFHCHHYNCFLQAVILDTAEYLPGIRDILTDAAQEIAHAQFSHFFAANANLDKPARKKAVEDYFRFCGFGIINLSQLSASGGETETEFEHYGIGWKIKFGKSKEPVSFFAAGFLAGATEAIFDLDPGTLNCRQTTCIAMGDPISRFVIRVNNVRKKLENSPGEGCYQTGALAQPININVDYHAIRNALTNMPLEGNEVNGLIDAFGVYLTRHYANYYCNISYRFLRLFEKQMGNEGLSIAVDLLTEAGRVCGFNTFGGIMQSNEWNALIKPMLTIKEDWIHGIVAVANAFGWGFWEIVELNPDKKLVIKITSSYEANSFLRSFGNSKFPISFLASGGMAGLMDIVYTLGLPGSAPITLDENTYNTISKDPKSFKARQIKCRSLGDEYDLIEVTRN